MKRTFFRNTLLFNIALIAYIIYLTWNEEYVLSMLACLISYHLIEHERELISLANEVRRLDAENLKLIKKKNEENLGE